MRIYAGKSTVGYSTIYVNVILQTHPHSVEIFNAENIFKIHIMSISFVEREQHLYLGISPFDFHEEKILKEICKSRNIVDVAADYMRI